MGPDSVGQHKLVFTLDESVASDFNPMSIKKGTQFIVMLIEAGSKEADEFRSETHDETKERFRKHMNSLINSIADLLGILPKDYREQFKNELKKENIIKNSTMELTIEGYALVITKLKQKRYELENRTNKS